MTGTSNDRAAGSGAEEHGSRMSGEAAHEEWNPFWAERERGETVQEVETGVWKRKRRRQPVASGSRVS